MSQPNGEPAPDADLPPQSAAPQSTWGRSKQIGQQVAADLPEGTGVFGAAKAGWQAGRAEAAASQSAPTHFGYVQDASTHGTFSNGDGGPELATADDVAGLHSRFDELSGQVSGMQSSGAGGQAQGNSNLQGLTPSRMPPRPASVSPLAASAQQRQAAGERMAQAGQQLQATRANFSANFAARQAQGSGVTQSGSGLGASDSMNQVTMSGALGRGTNPSLTPPSGLGSSASTWDRKRFLQ